MSAISGKRTPGWSTDVRSGDTLIVYESTEQVCEIDARPQGEAGDKAHRRATERHRARADDSRPARMEP